MIVDQLIDAANRIYTLMVEEEDLVKASRYACNVLEDLVEDDEFAANVGQLEEVHTAYEEEYAEVAADLHHVEHFLEVVEKKILRERGLKPELIESLVSAARTQIRAIRYQRIDYVALHKAIERIQVTVCNVAAHVRDEAKAKRMIQIGMYAACGAAMVA